LLCLKDWDLKDLIDEYKSLFDAIYNIECFSSGDIILFHAIEDELIRRGCKITTHVDVDVDIESPDNNSER